MEPQSPVHLITQYLQTLAGLPPKIVRVEGCYIVLTCPMCGTEYKKKQSLLTYAARQKNQTGLTCSNYCGTSRRFQLQPEAFKAVGDKLRGRVATGLHGRGVPRGPLSEGHRVHLSEVAREKGYRPSVRGGNGTGMSPAEKALWEFLEMRGFLWGHAVPLGKREQGYPTNYKLDFAHVQSQVALEVDGSSHRLAERQAQDLKKAVKLESLGWKVFRISNEKALSLSGILKSETAPTTSPEEFLSTIVKL